MASPPPFPAADRYYDRALSLPLFPAMMDEKVERVISAVRGLVSGNMA